MEEQGTERRREVPFMAQKHIIEVVIDEEQFLGELLMEDTWNQLQHTLLHGSACPIQLLLTAR